MAGSSFPPVSFFNTKLKTCLCLCLLGSGVPRVSNALTIFIKA